ARDALVVVEMQLRHTAQLHRLAQQHAQITGGIIEHPHVLLDLVLIVLAHHGDEHLGVTNVATDIHGGNGDEAQTRILDLLRNHLCQLALDLVADTLGTAIHFCHVSLPRTLQTTAGSEAATARPRHAGPGVLCRGLSFQGARPLDLLQYFDLLPDPNVVVTLHAATARRAVT